jgi:hypothetical protein
MNSITLMNFEKAKQLTHALLYNTHFEGYEFNTSFTLRFGRNSPIQFQGHALPMRVELHLLNNWWFYSRETWQKRLALFPLKDPVEPDEPVQAFELTDLRWSEGSIINCVSLMDEKLFISFINGKEITVSCKPCEGESWILREFGIDEHKQMWSVVSENGDYFVKTPKL